MQVGRPTALVACNSGVSWDVGLLVLKLESLEELGVVVYPMCRYLNITFLFYAILRKPFEFSLLNIFNLDTFVEEWLMQRD